MAFGISTGRQAKLKAFNDFLDKLKTQRDRKKPGKRKFNIATAVGVGAVTEFQRTQRPRKRKT